MRRKQWKQPAYACGINGETCKHAIKGAHGYHNEEWHYAVISDDERIALVLQVGSGIYTPDTPFRLDYREGKPSGDDLSLHVNFPTDREDIRSSDGGLENKCDLVKGGRCQVPQSSALAADEFVQAKFDKSAGFEQPDSFWDALSVKLWEGVNGLRDARLDWRKCEHCDGMGTVRAGTRAR